MHGMKKCVHNGRPEGPTLPIMQHAASSEATNSFIDYSDLRTHSNVSNVYKLVKLPFKRSQTKIECDAPKIYTCKYICIL